MAPQFLVRDLDAACGFYRDKLGFNIDFVYGEPAFYAGVVRDGITLHLKHTDEPEPSRQFKAQGEHLDIYVYTDDVDSLYDEYCTNEVSIMKPLIEEPWGTKEFAIQDNNGYIIYFGQVVA
jgi:catechol 2,3-dioxygenase-like lactoylglutathione lyase family enzyme